jgi:hypothetical protein
MAKGGGKGGGSRSGGHSRSAITGRYVTKATAARSPKTTVVESRGKGGKGKK